MKRRRLQAGDYTVGWICALPIELATAEEMLDEEDESLAQDSSDDNLYTLGRIGGHNVVLAYLPAGQTGTQSAATVAARMRSKFASIRFGLMVGIGGGVPTPESDIRLGDVVISQPYLQHRGVVQYDFGKTGAGGHIARTGSLNAPPVVLLNAVSKLRALHYRGRSNLATYLSTFDPLEHFSRSMVGPDILFEATYNHIGGATCEQCSREKEVKRTPRVGQGVAIHYGTIASGNQVIKDAITRDRISKELGGVMCFEMEAAGLMNNLPCLVIRGICDYADSHKNKKWQPYAAATAAACAKEILSVIPATEVVTTRTVDEATIYGILWSTINKLNLDQFLKMLLEVGQDEHISTIPPLDRNHPSFYWIFRNLDFVQWSSAGCSQVLWLSGPPERNIHQVSSYIVGQGKKTDHLVLYFFCSAAIKRKSIVTAFVHTLLKQIVCCSPMNKRILIIRSFLHSLLKEAFQKEAIPNWKERDFNEKDTPATNIHEILNAPANTLLSALGAFLVYEEQRSLLIVVDGLGQVEHQPDELGEIRVFVERLQQRTSKVKILLTSQPLAKIKDQFNGLPWIEHDRERKECLASLRFDNTRYKKISPEYKGSFEWIWAHNEYKKWSTPDASQLLYIQGKPGSGKSTLAKYFNQNLLKREPAVNLATIARFFYSFREGELQRSHYNMFRSILYDILKHDETFFYHRFQTEYRGQRRHGVPFNWDYASLKTVLKSIQDYSAAKRLYLIIDAVDESEDNDRRDVLDLLFKLCARTKHCIVKVFVASRPVGQLEVRRSQFHNFIRLQDETKLDISSFASSFLNRLSLRRHLAQATQYIVKNAQGVFLWVKLVGKELLECEEQGHSEKDILEFLKQLPTELREFYTLMLERMTRNKSNLPNKDMRNIWDGVKMFRFVLFARRPLTVDELRHALIIPDNLDTTFTPSDNSVQEDILPSKQRIIYCGGNFLEIKYNHGSGTVQVMHQTVREFFLDPCGDVANSKFRMCKKDAHICISIICIRYLMLCAANTTLAGTLPHVELWTSERFEYYAQYLDKRPLANYALSYLTHHIDGCHRDANVLDITSRFVDEVTHNPAVYLLENWVSSCLDQVILGKEQGAAAKEFRNKVLHAAVRNGLSTSAEVLLTVGADVNARDQFGWTPLSRAAGGGHEAVVKLLLETGKANVDSKDNDSGRTPLSRAAEGGHEAVVGLLLETGKVDVDSGDNNGQTPLSRAAEGGHEAVVKLLLETGKVDVDPSGRTPLSRAAEGGHEAVVKLLFETGKVDVDSKDNDWDGRTPLSRAAEGGHEAVVKLLLETGKVDVDSEDWDGRTPLSRAAEGGYEAMVKLLLETGKVDVDSKDNDGRTPLSQAAEGGHEAVVKLLFETGKVDVDSKDNNGQTPLSRAAEGGHEAVVKLLLGTGKAGVDSKDWDGGRTPLSRAAEGGHVAVVKLLLETGKVDVDSNDWDGGTPLSQAAEGGHEAVVKLLLETGKVDVDSKDKDWGGRTPLSRAAEGGHEAVVKLLLETGKVDVGSKDKDWGGRTPLSRAAEGGHEAVVKLLLETGKVDVDSKDKDRYGRTPLSWAAEGGHEAVVKLLLETGKVDVDSKDRYGWTPLSRAAEGGHEAVVKLLRLGV